MAVELSQNIREAIADSSSVKVVATIGKDGVPHAVVKGSVSVNEQGNIEFLDILESSKNNQNLVYSIWYEKLVAIQVFRAPLESYEILAKPVRSITAGKEFEERYRQLHEVFPNVDLGAIWQLEPVEVRDERLQVRVQEQEKTYPILQHLDRIL